MSQYVPLDRGGMTRTDTYVQRARRMIMLEIQCEHIARSVLSDLGRWLSRRRKSVAERRLAVNTELNTLGFSEEFIREQWSDQRHAELSVRRRTHTSVRPPAYDTDDLAQTLRLRYAVTSTPLWTFRTKSTPSTAP